MIDRTPRITARDQAIAVCLAAALFAVYLLTYRGGFHSVDEVSMFAVTENIAKRGAFDTDQVAWTQWTTTQREAQGFFGRDGSVYSKKGLTFSLLAAPLYWLALRLPGLGMLQTVTLLNALVTACTASVLFLYARRLGYGPTPAALLAGIFGLATSAWVYARYLFSEPAAAWLLLLAAYFVLAFRREGRLPYLLAAGLAGGLTVLTRANNLIALPFFGLYLLAVLWERRRPLGCGLVLLAAFVAAVGVPLSLLAGYNWVRSGNALQTGYDLAIFSPDVGLGLYKLLLSPLRGLFWFTPVLLLSLVAFPAFARRHWREAALAAGIVLANVGLFSAWTSGEGLSWGSRFMVPVLAFWALPSIEPLHRIAAGKKRGWLLAMVGLTGLSVLVQALGVLVNPWIDMIRLRELFPSEFLEETPVLYDPQYSPVLGQVRQLLSWTANRADLAWWQPAGIQVLPLAIGLTAVVLTLLATVVTLRASDSRPRVWPAVLSVVVVIAAAGLSIGWYFDHDYQFGQGGSAYNRILDRLVAEAGGNDVLVTIAPYDYHVPMNRFRERIPVYGFAEMQWPLPSEADRLLDRAVGLNRRVWLVTAGFRPAEARNGVERRLSERAFKASDDWYDDFRLCLYTSSAGEPSMASIDARLDDGIRLAAYSVGAIRDGLLPVTLDWRADTRPTEDYTVFVHLVGSDGRPVAQRDGQPVGGFSATSGWAAGQAVKDRHALRLPDAVPAGEYELRIGLYRASTGARLGVQLPDGSTSDHIRLTAVRLGGEGDR